MSRFRSPETAALYRERQRLSQTGKSRNKGKANPFYGRKHTHEALQKMSLAKLGKKRPPLSEEWRQHISEATRGKKREQR